jgi:hypothetical protein
MAFDATDGTYLSTFVGAGSGGLDGPRALDFGPDGDLYVTSENDDTVRRYAGATGAFVGVFVSAGSGGLDAPFDLVFGSAAAEPVPASQPGARVALFALLIVALLLAAGARCARGRRAAGEDEA